MSTVTARKIFIDEDPNQDNAATICPDCTKRGKTNQLRYMYINFDVAIYKCSGTDCMYPHTDFKYKNYTDKTIYRYEIVSVSDADGGGSSTASSETEIDDLLSDLAPGPAPEPPPTVESASIARLESELHNLLSDHLDVDEGLDFNSLFDSPKRPACEGAQKISPKRVKIESNPFESPRARQEPDPLSLFDSPKRCDMPNLFESPKRLEVGMASPKQVTQTPKIDLTLKPSMKPKPEVNGNNGIKPEPRKLSKAYEFIRQISDKSDFKVPPTPGRSPAKKQPHNGVRQKHSRSNGRKSQPKSRVREFSSSFLRQIERQYSNIKTSSQYKYEVVTDDTNRSQMIVKCVKKPPDPPGYKFKIEPD